MPVLLRATGAGSRQPAASTHHHRPVSQSSNTNELLRVPPASSRRFSQLSASPSSTGTAVHVISPRRVGDNEVSIPPPTWKQIFRTAYKKYHIKELFPLIFIMFYMVFGSIIFLWLEGSNDEKIKADNYREYNKQKEMFLRRMEEIWRDRAAQKRNVRRQFITEAVVNYEEQVGFSVKNETQWDLMSAMYFAGTLFTTIGYGDIACVTTAGRIMTVIYSCVGIPLMLITLNDLGKFLYNNINGCVKGFETFTTYLGIFKIFGKKEPKSDEIDMVERGEGDVCSIDSNHGSLPSISDLQSEGEEKMPKMSVKVALGITIGWIFLCSSLFRFWEDWTYGESCYFMYISLSTIGLGDISVARRDLMVMCFVFVIIGLSLVSMTINVVQVALEDFYVAMMLKLIMEYQEKMAAGGDQMGASVGMMRMWGNNKTAKLLMPLLSKEKKRMAMDKVEVEAKQQGIEIPAILTDLDEKTGMPKLFQIVENKEGEAPPAILEEMVQKQIELEEAIMTSYIAHDADTQTDTVNSTDKMEQTEDKTIEEQSTQTVEEQEKTGKDSETQTDIITNYNDIEVQTNRIETTETSSITLATPISETECQTERIDTKDELMQTFIAETVEIETMTEIETKNVRIQTPCPVIEQRTTQTEDLEDRKSPSKMSSARKRLRRAFAPKTTKKIPSAGDIPAMSEWKELEENDGISEGEEEKSDVEETQEDEGSIESLHWDPVDGLHAEKQQPVSKIKAMFENPKKIVEEKEKRKKSEIDRKGITRRTSSIKKDSRRSGSSRTRKTSE